MIIVIHNLKYIGVPRNDGFILIPNEIQAYLGGSKAFEFKGANGLCSRLILIQKML